MAFFRKFSDIPFAEEVADYIRAEDALFEIASKLDEPIASPAQISEKGSLSDEGRIWRGIKVLLPSFKEPVQNKFWSSPAVSPYEV